MTILGAVFLPQLPPENLTLAGRYVRLDGVGLDWLGSPTPLYAGATGRQTLRLSGELADGWGYEEWQDFCAIGDAGQIAQAVMRWVDAGADTVVLQPTPDDPDPEGFMRFVAQDVRALIPASR